MLLFVYALSMDKFTGGTESWRIKVQAQLDTWLASDAVSLSFPPDLSKEERRYIHEQAPRLGLSTRSSGKGEKRFLTVSKPTSTTSSELLGLTPTATAAMSAHVNRFPSQQLTGTFEPCESATQRTRRRKRKAPGRATRVKPAPHRVKLPAWEHRREVAELVKDNSVVLICGDTGCGKSTQVPQFLLDASDEPIRIACSQPRRLSAIAVAERVASERGEVAGESVGYEVRFESVVDPDSSLVFVTPGVLLRKLGDLAHEFTHVILDEVHEEDRDTEFLLVACRELVRRTNLKLILMSATLAVDKLASFFGGAPVVKIGGRAFPVSTFYLEEALEHTGRVQPPIVNDELLELISKLDTSLTCASCGQTGFASAQELGDHAADCDGGGDLVMADDGGVRNDMAVVADVLSKPAVLDVEQVVPVFDDAEDDTAGFGEMNAIVTAAQPTRPDVEAAVRAYQRTTDDEAVDVELVVDLVSYITKSKYDVGAVLVFVPGWADIVDVVSAIEERPELPCYCVALHSSLEAARQKLAFQPPPKGKWKVVVATNVAETSITIPDVAFVIDTGLEKTLSFDHFLGASVLRTQRVSRASAAQREGRAGRTKPGVCFRLWTRRRHKALAPRRKSELLRANLDGLCLRAAALVSQLQLFDGGARDFVRNALNPPADDAVDRAMQQLVGMGALERDSEVPTALGEALAKLPLDPHLGLAAMYARLLGASLTVTCVLDAKDPFVKGHTNTSKNAFAANTASDVVALCKAADGFRAARRQQNREAASRAYCRNHGLSYSTLALVDAATHQLDKALPPAKHQLKHDATKHTGLTGALAVAALYPNVAMRRPNESAYVTKSGAKCRLHASSLAAKKQSPFTSFAPNNSSKSQTVAFGSLLEHGAASGRTGLALATVVPAAPLSILLLCHARLDVDETDDDDDDHLRVSVNGLTFNVAPALLANILALRSRLRQALADLVAGRQSDAATLDAVNAAAAALAAEHIALVPQHPSYQAAASSSRSRTPPPTGGGRGGGAAAPRKPAPNSNRMVPAPPASSAPSSSHNSSASASKKKKGGPRS